MAKASDFLNRHLAAEVGPALVFFAVNYAWGIHAATVAVMLATLAAVGLGFVLNGRIPVIAVMTLAIVLAMGMASLLLDDVRFLKMKPTVGKCLFAAALAVGMAFRPTFLERTLGGLLYLTQHGWRMLTVSWIAFALLQAVLNEVVWRHADTNTWVNFKTALLPVSIIGYIAIARLVAPRCWDAAAEQAANSQVATKH